MTLGFDRLPWRSQIATFLVVSATGYVVCHLYWFVPLREQIALNRAALADLAVEIEQATVAGEGLRNLEDAVAELTTRREVLRTALARGRDAPEILRRLQTLAAQSNVSMRAFTPQAVEPGEAVTAWPIRLELNGLYHDLGLFFDRVSKSPQMITIDHVVVRAIDPPRVNATVNAECTATTFVLNDLAADEATGAEL